MPIEHLWFAEGDNSASRGRELGVSDITKLLRTGDLQFVVASIGSPLKWIPLQETFDFWRREGKPHLVDSSEDSFTLEDFPGEYAYCASLWQPAVGPLIVLLEVHH